MRLRQSEHGSTRHPEAYSPKDLAQQLWQDPSRSTAQHDVRDRRRWRVRAPVIGALLCTLLPAIASAQDRRVDLVIRNGRVIDGTGNPWFYGTVAIDDGRIVAVGDVTGITGETEIDATNLVVAPGFIDVHTHADTDLYKQPQAENFIRDGVTTIVTGNCGYGVRDVREYFDRLTKDGCALNVATLIGHNTVLRAVKGDKAGELTGEQMNEARAIVEKAMLDGAVGMSTGLIYTPGMYSPTDEIIELQKVAAKHGGIYASHMRSESNGIMEAIDEALRVGKEAGCRVQISHFKLPRDVAGKIGGDATVRKVLSAREAGQEVWVDQYPYTASSTTIRTLLPDWGSENGDEEAKRILQDPSQLERVLADMKKNHEIGRSRKDMSFAVIASSRAYPNFVGRNIKEIAQVMKFNADGGSDQELLAEKPPALPQVSMEDQYRAVIDIYLKGGAGCVFHTMDEAEVETIMKCPLVAIASDSGVREFGSGQPHPRGYGTNARVLGHYVRERQVISLEEAIRKMTSMPARAFRFDDRGTLREGFVADVVIFDPRTVIDRATFEKPHAYADGFEYVIVNGQIVLDPAGKLTGKLPGSPIFGPGRKD